MNLNNSATGRHLVPTASGERFLTCATFHVRNVQHQEPSTATDHRQRFKEIQGVQEAHPSLRLLAKERRRAHYQRHIPGWQGYPTVVVKYGTPGARLRTMVALTLAINLLRP